MILMTWMTKYGQNDANGGIMSTKRGCMEFTNVRLNPEGVSVCVCLNTGFDCNVGCSWSSQLDDRAMSVHPCTNYTSVHHK